jgi:nucleotide-binding universal stress UspA family protein
MKLINRILFPVDFSDACLSAARYVEAMAGRFEADIMLLHIVEPGEHTLAEELLPRRRAQLDAYLADELKYFNTRRVCVTGDDPAAEIIAAARDWQPDLVMLPTHGVGSFRRYTLGSVTAKLLKALDCPVWTNVHNESVLPLEEIHCRMVLCGVDLSDRSEYVLEWAAAMANENGAELAIVHAMKPIRQPVLAVGIQEELTGEAAADARRAIDRLRYTAGLRAPVFLEEGDTAGVVAGIEKEFGADLLVIGRHERGPENAFAIIRESPCPVISC